jgi:hypothetical protein
MIRSFLVAMGKMQDTGDFPGGLARLARLSRPRRLDIMVGRRRRRAVETVEQRQIAFAKLAEAATPMLCARDHTLYSEPITTLAPVVVQAIDSASEEMPMTANVVLARAPYVGLTRRLA